MFRRHVVDGALLEITQNALLIDQTHHFDVFFIKYTPI